MLNSRGLESSAAAAAAAVARVLLRPPPLLFVTSHIVFNLFKKICTPYYFLLFSPSPRRFDQCFFVVCAGLSALHGRNPPPHPPASRGSETSCIFVHL